MLVRRAPTVCAMIGIADPARAETDLAAGTLACPGCARPLQRVGARPHPHRARPRPCHAGPAAAPGPPATPCRVTHVLLPAVVARDGRHRRGDRLGVLASARGTGYRRIAAQLGRPLSTVRRWIRAVRDAERVEWLRAQAVEWLARVDRDVLGGLRPEATRLGEALTALAAAAVTLRARVAPRVPAWTLIGQITHGRLVAPAAPAAPG